MVLLTYSVSHAVQLQSTQTSLHRPRSLYQDWKEQNLTVNGITRLGKTGTAEQGEKWEG